MVILGRILVFLGLAAILHAGYSAVQCEYFLIILCKKCLEISLSLIKLEIDLP